jgi:hypothetical protein
MNFLVKTLSVVATIAAATVMAMGINTFTHQKEAVASTSTLNGTCGGAINFGRKGKTPDDGDSVNAFFRFNFQQSTAVGEFSITSRKINDQAYDKGFKTKDKVQVTFAITGGSLTDSYRLTPTIVPQGEDYPSMYIMPVNGGTTFLVQVIDDDITGICQKI